MRKRSRSIGEATTEHVFEQRQTSMARLVCVFVKNQVTVRLVRVRSIHSADLHCERDAFHRAAPATYPRRVPSADAQAARILGVFAESRIGAARFRLAQATLVGRLRSNV